MHLGRNFWRFVLLLAFAAGCSAVVDFDRSRIPDGEIPRPDGPGGPGQDGGEVDGGPEDAGMDAEMPMDATMDATMDADMDAGPDAQPDAGEDATVDAGDAGAACDLTTHEGCGDNELCCEGPMGPRCEGTDPLSQCAACREACTEEAADTCASRECQCGSEAECAGATSLCDTEVGACVECLGDGNCDDEQCVAGACEACDPEGNAGCSDGTPICEGSGDAPMCVSCADVDPDPCAEPAMCDPTSGQCVGCVDDGDCTSETTPICDDDDNVCAACTTGDCTEGVCDESTGACVECLDDNHCSGDEPVCDTSTNACVGCLSDGDCEDDTPLCSSDMLSCVACDDAAMGDPDTRCASKHDNTVCDEGSGACECEAGFFGNDCTEECDCVNGTCADGRDGDGSCMCDTGWDGDSCDVCITGCADGTPCDGDGEGDEKCENGCLPSGVCGVAEIGDDCDSHPDCEGDDVTCGGEDGTCGGLGATCGNDDDCDGDSGIQCSVSSGPGGTCGGTGAACTDSSQCINECLGMGMGMQICGG